jgi:hypothetical protein
MHAKEIKSTYWSDSYTPMFIASLLMIAKIWNQTKC